MTSIHYLIELADPKTHVFKVTLTIAAPADLQRVSLPAWIPGSYLVREFARHLSGLTVTQAGQPLALEQLDKANWQLRCNAAEPLLLSYRVYAFDSSVRAAFLDADRGFFNGTGLCLKVHGCEHESHAIAFGPLPEGWQVATAMTQTPDGRYQAADYDELVDHPFELGRFWQGQFQAGGVAHKLVVSGALPAFDAERLLVDSQRICEAQLAFWHGPEAKRHSPLPFGSYTFFLNAVEDAYGGLEHRASTALIAPRRDLPRVGQTEVSDGYVRLLGLISHEYFHSWNVKRLKPNTFAELDYAQENYTELLWFFEGFTSYYDELMLVRCGLIDEARYLKLLAANFNGVLATPGRKVQSLAQSSFDTWIKYYRPDENSPNSTISYYGKGALVALALDLSLRSADTAPSSLDELMRALWQRSHAGLTTGACGAIGEADILAVITELGGSALAERFEQWVHGTDDLPLPALFERIAVQLRSDKSTLAQRLGLRVNESGAGAGASLSVKQVLVGSAALAGGLCAGDEILGCNGWRIRRLEDAALTLSGTMELSFLVSRDQRLLTLATQLPASGLASSTNADSCEPVLFSLAEKAPVRAASLRKAWLGG
ncbi:M61 family metallopeptidase [Roseateles oligotrophus]|uniref:PDZ domain-containing protein n=1 Tax=Roseateles oligotrophus TaxID=1769250 RepID=A0ABT2YE05_9BURK|nr:PDZ domain-containing protein [Roseateles oligotrophus]MCV2368279.1 PDZ domain-containing protein [Roseateles oligotrophus]